ncbi:unnamed protein product, partial [Closterium sp. NIES-64]
IAANLTDGMFQGCYHGKQAHPPDLQAVLSRAWEAGVEKIIITGGSLEESRAALALAETDDRLFCTVGVHPTRCSEFDASGDPQKHLQSLLKLAEEGKAKGKVVAVGECGLDYDRLVFCPKEVQQKYFELQFDLAQATQLPMFLHMRAAADDFLEIVKRNDSRFVGGGVVHSFTGTCDERDAILAVPKLSIGINGCSLKTEDNLKAMAGIPPNRLMLETDSPYCDVRPTHAGHRFVGSKWAAKKKEAHSEEAMVKGRNEPCAIRQVLEVVCGYKGVEDVEEFARTVHDNTSSLFFPSRK